MKCLNTLIYTDHFYGLDGCIRLAAQFATSSFHYHSLVYTKSWRFLCWAHTKQKERHQAQTRKTRTSVGGNLEQSYRSIIEIHVEHCENCRYNLLDQVPVQVTCRQITELLEVKPIVIETRQYEVTCLPTPTREITQRFLEAGQYFDQLLEAVVIDLHNEYHVGFKRFLKICEELFDSTFQRYGVW